MSLCWIKSSRIIIFITVFNVLQTNEFMKLSNCVVVLSSNNIELCYMYKIMLPLSYYSQRITTFNWDSLSLFGLYKKPQARRGFRKKVGPCFFAYCAYFWVFNSRVLLTVHSVNWCPGCLWYFSIHYTEETFSVKSFSIYSDGVKGFQSYAIFAAAQLLYIDSFKTTYNWCAVEKYHTMKSWPPAHNVYIIYTYALTYVLGSE